MAVTKVIELIGNSTDSWEDAARNAVTAAAKSLHGITSVQVINWAATVADGEITEYQAAVKIAFLVE